MLKVVYIDSQYHYYLNMPPIQLCFWVKKVTLYQARLPSPLLQNTKLLLKV